MRFAPVPASFTHTDAVKLRAVSTTGPGVSSEPAPVKVAEPPRSVDHPVPVPTAVARLLPPASFALAPVVSSSGHQPAGLIAASVR